MFEPFDPEAHEVEAVLRASHWIEDAHDPARAEYRQMVRQRIDFEAAIGEDWARLSPDELRDAWELATDDVPRSSLPGPVTATPNEPKRRRFAPPSGPNTILTRGR